MSTITCPAAEIARSTSATYDSPRGNSRSSEVCEMNTRHGPASVPTLPFNRLLEPPPSDFQRTEAP